MAAAPTLPNLLPQNDNEDHLNFNATALSMLSIPPSELEQTSSHFTNLTRHPLPPEPCFISLSPTVDGSVTFSFPSYTIYINSIAAAERDAVVEALTSNARAYIRDPLAYLAPHAALYLAPDPALTWDLWRVALIAVGLFTLEYPHVVFSFRIDLGPSNEVMGIGALATN